MDQVTVLMAEDTAEDMAEDMALTEEGTDQVMAEAMVFIHWNYFFAFEFLNLFHNLN